MQIKLCTNCGETLECGANASGENCWCGELPTIMQPDSEVDCRCRKCLTTEIARKIEEYTATITPATAHESIAKNYGSNGKLIEGIDFYLNEQGLMVFTKWYHLKRGSCCKSGCRHCPYGFTAAS